MFINKLYEIKEYIDYRVRVHCMLTKYRHSRLCQKCGFFFQDDVVERFYQTKELDRPGYLIPKRYNDLVMHLFWIIVTLVPLFFYLVNVFFHGSLLHQAVIVIIFFLGRYIIMCGTITMFLYDSSRNYKSVATKTQQS